MKGMSAELTENETTESDSKNQGNESHSNKRKSCDRHNSGLYFFTFLHKVYLGGNNHVCYSDQEGDERTVTVESGSHNRVPPVKVSKWSCFLDSDSDIE
jgi:hypothetical protein